MFHCFPPYPLVCKKILQKSTNLLRKPGEPNAWHIAKWINHANFYVKIFLFK